MENRKIVWSIEANKDIDEIFYEMTLYSDVYARNWADNLYKNLELLEKFPEMGRIVPEKEIHFLREIIVAKYRIIYLITEEQLKIVRVQHSSIPLGKI
ncbi:MAG: type II toxin-antitoxin system RelE/ParE family toxin [Spirosomataceae bacterium]